MSTNDKTRNKLMESMRMTKSDPGKKPEETAVKESAKPTEKPTAKKAVEKKKPAKKVSKTTDAFQSSQRVWPD